MSDVIEKPISQVLYRQSSLETKLSPIHLSEESSSESEDEGKRASIRIVNYEMKSNVDQDGISSSDSNKLLRPTLGRVSGSEKKRFQEELQTALQKPLFKIREENKINFQINEQQSEKGKPDVKNIYKETTSAFTDELKNKLDEKQKELVQENKNVSKPIIPKKPTTKTDIERKVSICYISNSSDELQIMEKMSLSEPLEEQLLNVPKDTDNVKEDDSFQETDTSSVGLLKAFHITKKVNTEEVGHTCQSQNYKEEMATARPKSPRPVAIKGEKDESIWDKLGTLGRKKRIKEVQEVQAEGKYAIDSPGCPTAPIIPPEEYNLDDNEERCIIDPRAYEDPKFKELLNVLKEWINDELASQRIIVQDLSEDLYDGQVLQKLLEKLTGDKLDVPEVTQSEEGQKQKLSVVLGHFNQVLGIQRISHNKWSVEAIHSKNIVAITHLLVALARHFRPPVRLPEHVSVDVVIVQKIKGVLNHKVVSENLTKAYDDVGMRCERDAFDTLFDHAPDKLQVVKKSLVTFVNKHLNKMNFEVTEIESQFHDGVYLIMLMGLLEGFFVPHYSFHLTPHEFDQKVHNVNFAFELMEEVGLQQPKARPEDVVNMDLKSTLRVLYNLFLKYKTIL